MEYKQLRVIISGGGTGGHIFPAISIADELKRVNQFTEILFVGADGRMEMEKVPAAGYPIRGLKVAGLQRSFTPRAIWNNIQLPFKLRACSLKAERIIREFKPDIAVGVGGYASAPLLRKAQSMGIKTLLQEQNGFAGLSNRILAPKADRICVAYEGMEKFFPADKIVITGNPIRKDMHPYGDEERAEGMERYGLSPDCKHLLIIGGSLGSRTLNESVMKWLTDGCPGGEGVEVLWQCGGYYQNECTAFMRKKHLWNIHLQPFIKRMDLAYAAADAVISRSGASSVSELCATAKACIFVPSPNVAEDHQTHNAMALVNKDAAMIVKDSDAREELMPTALALLSDDEKRHMLEKNIAALARMDAAAAIVNEIYKLV